jgi:hypothetical protein
MGTCRFCDHQNPAGAERCEKCGGPLPVEGQTLASATPERLESIAPRSADPLDSEVLQLMRAGRKIEAIKLYREQRRAGLKEAKDAVEALAQQHGIPQRSVGCTGALFLAASAGLAWWFVA